MIGHDLVKEVLPEALPVPRLSWVITVVAGTTPGMPTGWRGGLPRNHRLLGRPLDDLVEFASVKPDPTALRTIVDFDTLAFRHDELHIFTYWTMHDDLLAVFQCSDGA